MIPVKDAKEAEPRDITPCGKTAALFPVEDIRLFAHGLLRALRHLHEQGRVAHNDLKECQIILRRAPGSQYGPSELKGEVVLLDFGVNREADENGHLLPCLIKGKGNGLYFAPEDSEGWVEEEIAGRQRVGAPVGPVPTSPAGRALTVKVDVFSAADLIGSISGMHAVTRVGVPAHMPAGLRDLLRAMCTLDVSQRPTAAEALRHPYFEGLPA